MSAWKYNDIFHSGTVGVRKLHIRLVSSHYKPRIRDAAGRYSTPACNALASELSIAVPPSYYGGSPACVRRGESYHGWGLAGVVQHHPADSGEHSPEQQGDRQADNHSQRNLHSSGETRS